MEPFKNILVSKAPLVAAEKIPLTQYYTDLRLDLTVNIYSYDSLFLFTFLLQVTGRVYFNISREKLAHTPHVHPLDQRETLLFFLRKSIRDSLGPGFPRALSSWPSCAEEFWGKDYFKDRPRVPASGLLRFNCGTLHHKLGENIISSSIA